jgi:zearalenone synthase (highly reducing iterative type I polyketide synthase)
MGKQALNAMVPRFIAEVTISATGPWEAGIRLPGFSTAEKHGLRDLIANVVMFTDDHGPDVINIQGLTLTEVGAGSSLISGQSGIRSIASKLVWKPAVEMLTTRELNNVLISQDGPDKLVEVRFDIDWEMKTNVSSICNSFTIQNQDFLCWK